MFRKTSEWPRPTPQKRLQVRPMRTYDIPVVEGWFHDSDLVRYAFGTEEDETRLRSMAASYLRELDANRHSILTLQNEEGHMIGFLRYHLTRQEGLRVARIGILLGERAHWGRGYGTEAMQFLIDYLFKEKSVDQIQLDTAEFNQRAQRCFEKVGFLRTDPPLYAQADPTPKIWMALSRR